MFYRKVVKTHKTNLELHVIKTGKRKETIKRSTL